MPDIVDCYRTLGLPRAASAPQVREAFRRLARQFHPDVQRNPAGRQRFIEVVHAYRVLQEELQLGRDEETCRRCPRCGRIAELLDGLDGRAGCADCLLGVAQRRRFLPLPLLVPVRHVGVLALYAGSIAFLAWYVARGSVLAAALAAVCILLGWGLLYVACLAIPDVD